jgi:signal transduction histidine kinase
MMYLILCFLAAGFVVIFYLWLFSKRDIRRLGLDLREILKGDTHAKLRTGTKDKDMVILVDEMNALLEKSQRDFIESKRTQADLKRAVTNISHDLRTPLTSAKGYVQLLENGGLNNETTQRYLATVRGRLDTLTLLMDSLFAFTQAVEDSLTLTRVNAANILRDVLSDNYEELVSRGFAVESEISDVPLFVTADEGALKRVLLNLITNVYTHGKDYLRLTLNGGAIEITNKADGLKNVNTEHIFERFYTADAARTHKRTGLGLAIAKELTQKMNGRITADKNGDTLTVRVLLN